MRLPIFCLAALLFLRPICGRFFVCPDACMAMFLPRDMESQADCLCSQTGDINNMQAIDAALAEIISELILSEPEIKTQMDSPKNRRSLQAIGSFHCPEYSASVVAEPKSMNDCTCDEPYIKTEDGCETRKTFECTGRYVLKQGISEASSFADCTCEQPYSTDQSTGDCYLSYCPRAGNYMTKENVTAVSSLADCDCLPPLIKNDQSGECYNGYECPEHSAKPANRGTNDFGDCICDYGYIRNDSAKECVVEKSSYKCPPNSLPKKNESSVASFFDCSCNRGFFSNIQMQSCDESKPNSSGRGGKLDKQAFECPNFSLALSGTPLGMEQCMCLPGFLPDYEAGECNWDAEAYKCPEHSYNPNPENYEVEFSQCECAKGYIRNEMELSCDPLQVSTSDSPAMNSINITVNENSNTTTSSEPVNVNACPAGSVRDYWPIHDKSSCTCVNGPLKSFPCELVTDSQELSTDSNGLLSCPHNSIVNNWPIRKIDDCVCKFGYEWDIKSNSSFSMFGAASSFRFCKEKETFHCPINAERIQESHTLHVSSDEPIDFANRCMCSPGMAVSQKNNTCVFNYESVLSSDTEEVKKPSLVLNGNEVAYQVVENNIMVTQGDIAIGKSFGYTEDGMHVYQLHGYYNNERDHRWRNGKMCFTVDPSLAFMEHVLLNVLNEVSQNTGFKFTKCIGNSCRDPDCVDHVKFKLVDSGSFSFIGRIGGPQTVGISPGSESGNIIHVVLHAIGLHHPTVRADREVHISILWECIPSQYRSFFVVEDTNLPNVPYDFNSIMHYPSFAFSDSDEPQCLSILPKVVDPLKRAMVSAKLGQREKMSLTDIQYVRSLYPELQTQDQVSKSIQGNHRQSHVHMKATAENPHSKKSAALSMAPFVFVVGFMTFVAFFSYEMHLRRKRGVDKDSDFLYSDPLIYDSEYSG